jgi:drug/metabolite transporter (DMT)-like permease
MTATFKPFSDPRLLALATIVLFSFGPIVAKLLSIQSQFLFITLSFSFTSIIFIFGLFFLQKLSLADVINKFKPSYLFFGLFGYFLYWQCFFQGLREFTSASGTTVLNYTWPIFTVIFTELFFRTSSKTKRYRLVQAAGVSFGFLAVVVLATEGDLASFQIPSFVGFLWGLGAGVSYGLFSAFSSSVKSEDQLTFLTISVVTSLAAMLPFSYSELHLLSTLHFDDFALVAFLGFFIDGLGYMAWASANRQAKEKNIDISSIASLIFFLPIVSIAMLSMVLGEKELFHPYFIITIALLIVSTILCQKTDLIASKLKQSSASQV